MEYHTVMGVSEGCVDTRNAYRPVFQEMSSLRGLRGRFPDSRQKFPDLGVINIVQICRHLLPVVIPAGCSLGSHTPGRRRPTGSSAGTGLRCRAWKPTVRKDGLP